MKENAITDKLSDKNMLDDLQKLLDEELAKPWEERDLDAIEEITAAMVDINDEEVPQPVSAETVLGETAERKRRRMVLFRRWAAVISACFAVCIALNFYTIRTYGSNVVETVIKAARSGFSIDLKELKDIDTDNYPVTTTAAITGSTVMTTATTTATGSYWYTSATTAFVGTYTEYTTTMITSATTASGGASVTPPSSTSSGVIDLCDENARGFAEQLITAAAKYGIEPCVPVYMPAFLRDIRITDVNYEELSDSKDFYASFAADGTAVDVIIERYASEDVMPEVLIPSDALSSRTFNSGRLKGIIIEDGDSCTVLFMDGNTAYTVHTSGISADDVYDISTSLLPYFSAEDK
ncbi:hypothetical protein [Ruminococcus flavefaciens]|uniref:hypothetical protein n=1 Tax=Ruminococcus flavefaciens TaxID=1265 RepID=UPI0002D76DDF|nr:hypothetical protein [Ruminococcus flavefaciens]